MKRRESVRIAVALVALWIASPGTLIALDSDHISRELVGTWIGEDASIVLSDDGTGTLNYHPPATYLYCSAILDGKFAIKHWSLSGKKIKLNIKQKPEARYDDGRAYNLHIKGEFRSPWLILELWDANHTRRVAMRRDGANEPDQALKKLLGVPD